MIPDAAKKMDTITINGYDILVAHGGNAFYLNFEDRPRNLIDQDELLLWWSLIEQAKEQYLDNYESEELNYAERRITQTRNNAARTLEEHAAKLLHAADNLRRE